MSGIRRAPRPENEFFVAANSTARDSRLSFRARGILFRILSNRDNFRMTAVDLANEGKEGRGAILAALKELRAVGYATTTRTQGADGRWRTETVIFDVPQVSSSTEVGKPDFGLPDVGFPDLNQKYQKNDQQQHASFCADADGAAAAPAKPDKKRKSPQRWPSGMATWYAAEDAHALKLETTVDSKLLRAAVAAVRNSPNGRGKPKSPVPALVDDELQAMAARALRGANRTASHDAQESGPPPLPPAEARGRLARAKAALGRGTNP